MANILCIDDEVGIRSIYKRKFAREGHAIDLAEDGQLGVEAFLREPKKYDLVITDMNMPNRDGLYVIEQIKKVDLLQKVALIASCNPEDLQNARNLGVDGYLEKPFLLSDLSDFVNGFLQ
ncbi:MAG: response regulator [Candidatus Woesearchaeota archaeon]